MENSGIDLSEIEPGDMNAISYIIAGQIKSAAEGSTKALEYLN